MKLVDILARELKAWPCPGRKLCQGHKGHIYPTDGGDTYAVTDRAEDWELADVTRDQWQAAVDALKDGKVAEWNGEGLPPVGTVCEILENKTTSTWGLVKVIAHVTDDPRFNPIAIYIPEKDPSAVVGQAVAKSFRPIRTPEQIAADEKSSIINKMVTDSGWTINGCPSQWVAAFEALYDAGYRKFEIVDN